MKIDLNKLDEDITSYIEDDKLLMDEAAKITSVELEELLKQKELLEPCELSPEFEANMEKLFLMDDIRTQVLAERKKRFHTRMRWAAAIVMCTIATVFIGIKTEAIPLPKFSYTIKKDDSSYAYLLEQEKLVKDTLEEKYVLDSIPKGYQFVNTSESNLALYSQYGNSVGEKCDFQQFSKDVIMRADEILNDYKEIVLDGCKYFVMERNTFKQIRWYENGYQYGIQAKLPLTQLVEMAQTIRKQ